MEHELKNKDWEVPSLSIDDKTRLFETVKNRYMRRRKNRRRLMIVSSVFLPVAILGGVLVFSLGNSDQDLISQLKREVSVCNELQYYTKDRDEKPEVKYEFEL